MLPQYTTVAQAIAEVKDFSPDGDFTFQDLRGAERRYSFVEIESDTAARGAALQAMGLDKGDRVGLIVIEPEDFVLTFLACLRVGVVPVPLYPPMSFASLDAYTARSQKVLDNSGAKVLIASAKLQNVLWAMVDHVPSLLKLLPVEDLRTAQGKPSYPTITPEDLAFLQYTSGSTADPKGVMVTHGSLIANSRGIIHEGLQLVPGKDRGVSWLPLYHDMGLIGFVIAPICNAINVSFIPTLRFIKRPSVWLDTISRHRGNATFAPNFAFALVGKRVKKSQLAELDLSCLRVVGCGAEPIQPETMREFTELFSRECGMPETAIMPAYGMAEATLAISLKPACEAMQTLLVDAERFSEHGEAISPVDDKPTTEWVACGVPFEGHEVCAMADDGTLLPDGVEGELCHKGPSVTAGYYKNPEATAKAYRDGWLHTGDLGFVKDRQVYITGRIKDLIIVNGRNVHPQAVEWAVAEVNKVRKGNVVAFAVPSPAGEQMVIALETRLQETDELVAAVRSTVQKELSLTAKDIICLKPGSLPKTSSGKLQRRKTRQMYLDGALAENSSRHAGAQAARVTLARHVAASMWSRAKATLRG